MCNGTPLTVGKIFASSGFLTWALAGLEPGTARSAGQCLTYLATGALRGERKDINVTIPNLVR